MRKKTVFLIIVVALVVVAGVIWGKSYYEDRYVGKDYYAMVPFGYDITPETMYDDSGRAQDKGKTYNLTAYNEKGEAKKVSFDVYGEDSTKYPQPGDFLLVKASNQIVVNQSIIQENSVPEGALAKIKENQ